MQTETPLPDPNTDLATESVPSDVQHRRVLSRFDGRMRTAPGERGPGGMFAIV